MKNIIFSTIILLFISCNGPLNKKYSKATVDQDLEEMQKSGKVSQEEAGILIGAMMKAEFTGESLEGKTYKQIIKEFKNAESEQEKLKNEEMERLAKLQQKMNEAVVVAVTSMSVEEYNYDDAFVFGFAVKNKSDKTIDAIKFNFSFANKLGDSIGGDYTLSITDDQIKPGKTFNGQFIFDFNQFESEDTRLASSDFSNLKQKIQIVKIIFDDGTTIE